MPRRQAMLQAELDAQRARQYVDERQKAAELYAQAILLEEQAQELRRQAQSHERSANVAGAALRREIGQRAFEVAIRQVPMPERPPEQATKEMRWQVPPTPQYRAPAPDPLRDSDSTATGPLPPDPAQDPRFRLPDIRVCDGGFYVGGEWLREVTLAVSSNGVYIKK